MGLEEVLSEVAVEDVNVNVFREGVVSFVNTPPRMELRGFEEAVARRGMHSIGGGGGGGSVKS